MVVTHTCIHVYTYENKHNWLEKSPEEVKTSLLNHDLNS